jgi:hypothetical protein
VLRIRFAVRFLRRRINGYLPSASDMETKLEKHNYSGLEMHPTEA